MENNEIDKFLMAYRQGTTADFIQPKVNGKWGPLWTLPPCDPAATQRVGQQMVRMGVAEVRWVRKARLRTGNNVSDVVIVHEMPSGKQIVYELHEGKKLYNVQSLTDDCALSLRNSIQSA